MSPRSLGEVLAAQDPAAPALVAPGARLTYGELMALATRAAGALHELGVRHGERVGLDRPCDEQWLALFYGAALLGAVAVPIVGGAQCQRVLRELPAGGGSAPAPAAGPEDLLLIQHSGRGGGGVMLTHDGLLRNAMATGERVGVTREDRLISLLPGSRLCGVVPAALTSLVYGACLVMLPDPQAAPETLVREGCTLAWGDDTAFGDLMQQAGSAKLRLSLRGGWAAAGPETLRGIVDRLGAKHVCAAYALTEASGTVTVSDWRDPEELRAQGLATPLPELQLRTLDGEIQVRGWSVMRGYYDDPGATAQVFTEDGWLRTGDPGELHPGGRLQMLGRRV